MEESERLRREIRRLQGLIDSHRSTHGAAPRPSWSNPRQQQNPPYSRRGAFSGRYPPRDFQQGRSWRKKYSLVNPPPSRAFGIKQENRAAPIPAGSPERHVDLTRDGNIVVGIQVTQRSGLVLGAEGFRAESFGPKGFGAEGLEGFGPKGFGAEGLEGFGSKDFGAEGLEGFGAEGLEGFGPKGFGAEGLEGFGPKDFGPKEDFDAEAFGPKDFGPKEDFDAEAFEGFGPKDFDAEGFGAEDFGAEGFKGFGTEGFGPKDLDAEGFESFSPKGFGAEAFGPKDLDPEAFEGFGPEGFGPEGFGPEVFVPQTFSAPSSGLKTEPTAPGEDQSGLQSSAPPYPPQKEGRKPSLSVSFSSSHRVVSSSYAALSRRPHSVRLSAEGAETSRAPCENAVAPKTQPQLPRPPPGCQQARHLVWCKPEVENSGQTGFERGGDARRELLGVVGASSRALGVKGRFSALHKAPGVQRAAAMMPTVSGKASKFRRSNYTWVANPGRCWRAVKRWASPRGPEGARKIAGGAKTAAPKSDSGSKAKKSPPKAGVSPSKYKWKAAALQPSPSTSRSAFRWRCEEEEEEEEKPSPSSFPQTLSLGFGGTKPFGDAVPSGYKVKSRTKIIRRKGSPADKKSSPTPPAPLRSPFQAKKRNLRGKAALPKRCSPKGLLQLTKHRLCRLPAARSQLSSREGASLLFARSPPANKVIKTRYRIVKKNVGFPSSSFSSPVPSWKTRRLGTSRSLLLNQARPSPQGTKSQPVPPGWRSKGYRCIGGVMYRVSANKLSKTSSTPSRGRDLSTKSPGRAVRLSGTPGGSGFSPSGILNRSTTSRYIASRAVQRSLAIIRQAKQKKEKKKEYCMYYNRFGRCNRGENCPYIHDPEKVAVCTRFLRGTCKKTDGNCPFSHKVSKDKMPVCSYFLKGICSNSNCPYSHVYVSRKAEVCQDFLKGYCPMGEKCKKKHTLVCPDFAKKGVCPQGARCKLLHPRKKRQPRGDSADPPSKCRRLCEETGRNHPAQPCDDGEVPGPSGAEQDVKFWRDADASPSSRLQKLPSFISLLSSASPGDEGCIVERDEDEPDDEPAGTKWKRTLSWAASRDPENASQEEGGGRGKQLQIKPRL
ncbi:zinc finger CCCH domain-containing protein 3 isoform X3 [Aythya fuligula]|uniref:Zinc finger CCCH domain-containing protein 3 n=1 Tax=Aythya fuligula TaxID=219594 RepID=A0A6J3CPL8_AYTFU|nr:zinc finger CCCH domain-containing protein 3 isoform X3 [Aythya fuligula]